MGISTSMCIPKRAEISDNKVQVKGSPENERFYKYLAYLTEQRVKADPLRKQLQDPSAEGDKSKIEAELEVINREVLVFQQKFVQQQPEAFTSKLIRANMSLDMPDFEGEEQEVQVKRWRYQQAHFFDNIDLEDPKMLRTPFLFRQIDAFVNKLQVQHPDTIAKALDFVLRSVQPADETFKFYLIHYLNEFARSNIVGDGRRLRAPGRKLLCQRPRAMDG